MANSLKMIKYDELPNREEMYLAEEGDLALFERFGWVDVPEPFDLAEFSRRLVLDFNSYDPGEMEKTAVAIIRLHEYRSADVRTSSPKIEYPPVSLEYI